MTDDSEKPPVLFSEGLAFFGAVTASVSHELNNVMSIIDQTAGLLQDMIAAEREGTPINIERLAGAGHAVQVQTERGLGIIKRLNRFSHSADETCTEFDVAEVLGNLVELCRRLANLKYVQLDLESCAERPKLVGSPFFVQAAVFLSLRLALAAAKRDDAIGVSIGTDGSDVVVTLKCPRPIDVGNRDATSLQLVMDHSGARLNIRNEGNGTLLDLVFVGGGRNGSSG